MHEDLQKEFREELKKKNQLLQFEESLSAEFSMLQRQTVLDDIKAVRESIARDTVELEKLNLELDEVEKAPGSKEGYEKKQELKEKIKNIKQLLVDSADAISTGEPENGIVSLQQKLQFWNQQYTEHIARASQHRQIAELSDTFTLNRKPEPKTAAEAK